MCYKLCWYNTEWAWPSFYPLKILMSHFSYLIKAGDTFATISWRIFLAFFFTLLIALASVWTKLPGILGSEASSTMAFWTLILKSKTYETITQQKHSRHTTAGLLWDSDTLWATYHYRSTLQALKNLHTEISCTPSALKVIQ